MNFQTADVLRELANLLRPTDQLRKRSKVHRNHMTHIEEADCHGGLTWAHRVMVSDRQQRDVRRIEFANEFHVSKKRRIARVIYGQPARQPDYVATGFAAIDDFVAVLDPAGMYGVYHRDFDLAGLLRATFVHCARARNSLRFEPNAQFINSHDLRLKLF